MSSVSQSQPDSSDSGSFTPEHGTTVISRQAEIPLTEPSRYITGIYALNVRSPEGTTGDWHDVFHWREGIDRPVEVQVAGVNMSDTSVIFGDFGIFDARDQFVRRGFLSASEARPVYVANHFRAILDMLFASLVRYGQVYNLTGATDDWIDTDEQKELVLSMAAQIAPHVDSEAQVALKAWIERERRGRKW